MVKVTAVKIPARDSEADNWNTNFEDVLHALQELAIEGLICDGGHHKQWYLEQIAWGLGLTPEKLKAWGNDWESGIAP